MPAWAHWDTNVGLMHMTRWHLHVWYHPWMFMLSLGRQLALQATNSFRFHIQVIIHDNFFTMSIIGCSVTWHTYYVECRALLLMPSWDCLVINSLVGYTNFCEYSLKQLASNYAHSAKVNYRIFVKLMVKVLTSVESPTCKWWFYFK